MSTTSKEFFTFSKGEGPAVTDQLGEKHRTYDAVALDAEEGNYYGFIEKVLPGNQFQVAWFYEPAEVELTAKDRKACLKNELFLSNHVDSNEGGTIAFRPTIYVCSNKKMVEEATKARNRLRPADRERAFIARRVFDHTKYQLGSVNLRQWNLHKHFQYMVERTKELLVPVNQLRYLMSWLIPLADVPGKAVVPDIEHGLGVIYNMGITFEDLVTTDVYKTCVKLFKHHPEPTVRSMARRTRAKLREVEDSYRLNHTKDALRRLQGRKRPRTSTASSDDVANAATPSAKPGRAGAGDAAKGAASSSSAQAGAKKGKAVKKADEGACEEEEDGEGDDNKEDEKEAGNDDDEEEEVDDDDDDDEENDEDGEDDEEGSLQFGQSAHLNKDPDEKMLGEQRLGDQLWDAVHDFSDPEEEVVNIQGKSLRVLSERRGHLVLHFDA